MPKKIAIVEDEVELAALIEYNLGRHGYDAQILGGSKGTLRALEQGKPDLILLDVMLPDGAGLQPGSASGSGVGGISLRHAAHGRCSRASPARTDRRTAGQSALPHDGARLRVSFRRSRMTGKIFLKLIAAVFCLLLLALVTV